MSASRPSRQPSSTGFGYDALGRLTSVTNALNKVTRYGYDEAGNQTNQVDALNRTTTFEYDAIITNQYDTMNRLTNRMSANGYQVSSAYNPTNGSLTNMIDPSGTTA